MPADLVPVSARIKTTTLNAYLRKRIELVYPRSPGLATLRAFKRISFNHSGREVHWFPRIRRRELESGLGEQITVAFVATNTRVEARLPWRHYHLTERISRYERLVNKGKEALAGIVETVANELVNDFNASFQRKIYANANATGSLDIAGLETFTQPGAAISGSPCRNGSGTFAGISLALGALGGAWSGNWPMGSGDAEYSAWTSMMVQTNGSFFSGSTDSWKNNWQEQIRFAKTYLTMLYDVNPRVLLVNPELLRQAADSLKSTYRLEVTAKSPLVDLGIRTLQFEGVEMVADSAVPANVGYLFDPDYLELMCLTGQLFERTQDDDITTQTELIRLDFDGQLVTHSPAAVAKFLTV